MHTTPIKLVTIVGEALLADRLVEIARCCGAKGYTISDARGGGVLNRGFTDLGPQNARIELLVSAEVADKLLDLLARDWFPHYALIAWVTDAHVVRPAHFAG